MTALFDLWDIIRFEGGFAQFVGYLGMFARVFVLALIGLLFQLLSWSSLEFTGRV